MKTPLLASTFYSDSYKRMVELHPFGKKSIDCDAVIKNAAATRQAWESAQKAIASREFRIVVLEGITDLLKVNRLDESSVVGFLSLRPADLHIIATGRECARIPH